MPVVETDASGHVRYNSTQPLVVLNSGKVEKAIETSILQQRRLHATATCPSQVLQQAGVAFQCAVRVGSSATPYTFAVVELDNSGHVRYAAS